MRPPLSIDPESNDPMLGSLRGAMGRAIRSGCAIRQWQPCPVALSNFDAVDGEHWNRSAARRTGPPVNDERS